MKCKVQGEACVCGYVSTPICVIVVCAVLSLWMQGDSPGCSGGFLCGLTVVENGTRGEGEWGKRSRGENGTYSTKICASLLDPCTQRLVKVPPPQRSWVDVWLNG